MARDFDGTDDRIDWPSIFTTSGQAKTVCLWTYLDNATGFAYFWNTHTAPDTGLGTLFFLTTTAGQLQVSKVGSVTGFNASVGSTLITGVWTHILFHDDGS